MCPPSRCYTISASSVPAAPAGSESSQMTKTQALPARSSPLSKQARPASRGSTGMPLNVAEKETGSRFKQSRNPALPFTTGWHRERESRRHLAPQLLRAGVTCLISPPRFYLNNEHLRNVQQCVSVFNIFLIFTVIWRHKDSS